MDALIKRFYDLPSIPKIVQELITSFSDKRIDSSQVSKKIQTDPAIMAKVLRLANSARYGCGRKVANIDNAVVLLGFDALKTLIVASGVTASLNDIPGMEMRNFWRKSFIIASICKLIAKNTPNFDPETAFTCGMLHKIGIAMLYLGHNEQMVALRKRVEEENLVLWDEEKNCFGYDDASVAAELAKFWKFPEEIQLALAHQNDPISSPEEGKYATIVHLAKQLYKIFEQEDTSVEDTIASMPQNLIEKIELNTEDLCEHLTALTQSNDDIEELLAA